MGRRMTVTGLLLVLAVACTADDADAPRALGRATTLPEDAEIYTTLVGGELVL